MVSLSALLAAAVLSLLVLSFFTAEGFEFVAEIKDFAEKSFTLLEKGLSVLLSSKVLVSAAAILGAIWVRLTLRVHLSALKRNAEAQEYNGQKTSFSESRLMRMMYAVVRATMSSSGKSATPSLSGQWRVSHPGFGGSVSSSKLSSR